MDVRLWQSGPHVEALTIGPLDLRYRQSECFAFTDGTKWVVCRGALSRGFIARDAEWLATDEFAERLAAVLKRVVVTNDG